MHRSALLRWVSLVSPTRSSSVTSSFRCIRSLSSPVHALWQGLLKLQEDKVSLRCREADLALVKEVMNDALTLYRQKTGNSATITIDSDWLSPAYSANNQADFWSVFEDLRWIDVWLTESVPAA